MEDRGKSLQNIEILLSLGNWLPWRSGVISECKEVHDILVELSDQQEISVLENWLKSSDL